MKQLLEEIHFIQDTFNPDLKIMGIVASKYDKRTTLSTQILITLKSSFPEHVFNTIINSNIDVVRSQIAHKSIFDYNKKGAAAKDFIALVEEVING
ncbi:sporulation initiation inhibitor protein Soj [Candidatus Magnetoovum chiemensis]|nr:sporulation initiation inhibitor protein Soj [Candidatus Magnetoovum chiemensis]